MKNKEGKDIKRIKSEIWVTDFIIDFSYLTKRNNFKRQSRIVTALNKKEAINAFWKWIYFFNNKNPYRSMSNVKILGVQEQEGRYIEL